MFAGADILAGELSSQIHSQCPSQEFEHGGQVFSLELRTISGDVDLPQHNFKTSDFNPQGKGGMSFDDLHFVFPFLMQIVPLILQVLFYILLWTLNYSTLDHFISNKVFTKCMSHQP